MSKNFTIIGTGVTGTSVLIELTRQLKQLYKAGNISQKITVTTIDKHLSNGHGYPYNPIGCHPEHLLNHPATEMSVKPVDEFGNEKPADFEVSGWHSYDFVKWLEIRRNWIIEKYPEMVRAAHPGIALDQWRPDPKAHYPRGLYGFYMQDRFDEAVLQLRTIGIEVKIYNGTEAIDGITLDKHFSLTLKDLETDLNITIVTDKVLLATGRWARYSHKQFEVPFYFDKPYPAKSLIDAIQPSILKDGKAKHIFIQGMGLSALDAILSMTTGKFYRDDQGKMSYDPGENHAKITAFSRSGYFPIVRGLPQKMPQLKHFTKEALDGIKRENGGHLTLAGLKHIIEKELGEHLERNIDLAEYFLPEISTEKKLKDDLKKAKEGNIVYALSRQILGFGLFRHLAPEDKEYFIKNLRTYFLQNIAAIPVINAEKMIALLESGVLSAVRIGYNNSTVTVEDDKMRLSYLDANGERKNLYADYMIKAAGDELDIEKNPDPLIKSLLKQGEIIPNREPYHNKEEQRTLTAKTGGIKVDLHNYSVMRINQQGLEEKSKILSALGLLVANWTDRDFASASIKAAHFLVNHWIDELRSKPIRRHPISAINSFLNAIFGENS